MNLVTMHGIAPDGGKLTVTVDLDDMDCPAEHGIACCTLPIGHPGPWHVATTRDTIVHSWPVETVDGSRRWMGELE